MAVHALGHRSSNCEILCCAGQTSHSLVSSRDENLASTRWKDNHGAIGREHHKGRQAGALLTRLLMVIMTSSRLICNPCIVERELPQVPRRDVGLRGDLLEAVSALDDK